jgi:hypothetical protein
MPKTPGRRDNHPGRPVRAPDNHHAGRRPRERLLSVEDAHARNERTCIPAPVRMVRPDELPAATLGFLHPALTSTPAATSSHSPPAEDGDRRAVSFLRCRYGTSGDLGGCPEHRRGALHPQITQRMGRRGRWGSPCGGAGPREVDARYLRGTWQADQDHQLGRQVAVVLAWQVTGCAVCSQTVRQ